MHRYFLFALGIWLLICLPVSAQFEGDSIGIYQFAGKAIPRSLLDDISVQFDETPFELALNEISTKGGIQLSYNRDKLPLRQSVSARLENVMVLEALLTVLKKTGTMLQITSDGTLAITNNPQQTTNSSSSQSSIRGKLKGEVIDATSGDALPGANVILKGTSIGAATDLNGYYVITNIPPGHYTVQVKFIGYQDVELPVFVGGGEDVQLNASMEWVAVKGQEVTITAQAKGQVAAINQQIRSGSITNIVAADRIQEVPDANAAESVGRLPGVSIKRSSGEGDEVVIRGLQPRLNLITVNDIRMPSTNEYNTAVGLAGISQYMLDGIEVRKSLTAQDDADVIGGIVDLKLATAPERFHWNAIFDGMYNGLTKNYGSYRGTIQGSNRFFNNSLGVIGQLNIEQADRTRHRYSAGFNKDERVSVNEGVFLVDGNYQLHKIVRDRFGFNILADYKLPRGKIQLNSIYNKFDEDRWERDYTFDTSGTPAIDKWNNSIYSENHSFINGLNLETEILGFAIFDFGGSITRGVREGYKNTLRFRYDDAAPTPVDPEFTESTYGKTAYDVIPHFRDASENYDIFGIQKDDMNFKENESTWQSNLKIPFNLHKQLSGYVKFGGKLRFKNRDYDYEQNGGDGIWGGGDPIRTQILRDNPEIDWPFDWKTRPQGAEIPAYPLYAAGADNILKDRVKLINFSDRRWVDQLVNRAEAANWAGLDSWIVGAGDFGSDYQGDEKFYAGYIMTDLNWGERVSLNAGLRYEHEETKYAGYGVKAVASIQDMVDTLSAVTRTNYYLLPSTNLRFRYTNWGDVRLAYSKSLARPEYYAFIPHYSADLRLSLSSSAGNPGLKPAVSENFDIIFSFYNNYIGLFTLGGFYKKINDFFYNRSFKVIDVAEDNKVHGYENITVPKGQYINVWFNNTEASTVQGLEFDWQTNFWYLPRPFNGLVLNVNYTMISSESYYYVSDVKKEYYGTRPWEFTEVRVDSFETRRLIDQPNDVFNLSLGYDYRGFSMRVAYYFQGNTLSGKGDKAENDTFDQDYKRLDISLRQRLPLDGLSLQFLWSNITGVPDEEYRWIKNFNSFEEYYGSTGSLGIRYEF